MGRPRGFDEGEVVAAAVALFAGRAYDSVSVDDLVTHLGVHRNSLYKTFGSKRGLYLAALRRHLEQDVLPLVGAEVGPTALVAVVGAIDAGDLDLLLFAAVERAPVDDEVAAETARALTWLDEALDGHGIAGGLLTAAALGRRVRARAGIDSPPLDDRGLTVVPPRSSYRTTKMGG
jgi:TetR/AcrR family transcriptional repressor of nem operon